MSSVAIDRPRVNPSAATNRSGSWDWWLIGVSALLASFGLVMLVSTSTAMADNRYGDATHFVTRQTVGLGAGLGLAVVALTVPWSWYRRYTYWALGVAFVLLMLVWSPLGFGANGARRWVSFGVINLQASELAKVVAIVFSADYLTKNASRIDDVVGTLVPLMVLSAFVVVPVALEPDFGSTVILCALVTFQVFLAGIRWRWLFAVGALGGGALSLFALLEPYRLRRLASFWDPLSDAADGGYQVVQGWVALGAGGVFGRGLSRGLAQTGFLPEAHTDFIAAVVGEELGAVGWALLVAAYAVVLWRGSVIARDAGSLYGTLLAGGLTMLLMSQTVINLGVIVGWLPAKGLVLPLMSYGASAAMVHMLCVGILLRVGLESPSRRT